MNIATTSRKFHKWLSMIIGIQLLLWTLSGFYMVVINIDYIRGNHLVKNMNQPVANMADSVFPTSQILQRYKNVESITFKSVLNSPHYIVKADGSNHLINAISGIERSPINQSMATDIARYHYAGNAEIKKITLLTQDPPSELYSRPLPLWQVNFDDAISTSFYISPNTGRLVTRRHDFWRIFDFFWMLHIMDYEDRENIHNNLLRLATIGSLLSVIAGFFLLIAKEKA